MRIGIDGQTLLERSAGVTYYIKGLLREILRQDKDNHYDLFFFRLFHKEPEHMFGHGRNFTYKYQRIFPYKFFKYATYAGMGLPLIPLELFFGRHDLYLFPNFVEYPHWSGKGVVVIHDLTFEKVPQFVGLTNTTFLRKFVPISARRAARIVVNSEFTKREVIEAYSVPGDKITVAYPGADAELFRPASKEEIEAVRKKYGLKKPFILFLGTLEPRKNIPAILRAYAALKDRDDLHLVLAGKKGWLSGEIFKTIGELGLQEHVVLPGYIPGEDRPKLLGAAEVFVYPSFFEGFGMPVVEAQACGTPVVTSNTTSLPEAAGEGALLVDPNDVGELKGALERVLSSSELRGTLRKKGLANAERFRWDKSAEKVINVFNSLI